MYCEIPDFGRCCLCMPLRKGILVFGYLNMLFAALMVSSYSYAVHINANHTMLMFHGSVSPVEDEACLVIHLIDFLFGILLIVGAHKKSVTYLKVYFYYAVTTLMAILVLQIIGVASSQYPGFVIMEAGSMFLTGFCIHLYLIFLIRSLLKKLDISGHTYENQLNQFVNGEAKPDDNDVYTSTVVPSETV